MVCLLGWFRVRGVTSSSHGERGTRPARRLRRTPRTDVTVVAPGIPGRTPETAGTRYRTRPYAARVSPRILHALSCAVADGVAECVSKANRMRLPGGVDCERPRSIARRSSGPRRSRSLSLQNLAIRRRNGAPPLSTPGTPQHSPTVSRETVGECCGKDRRPGHDRAAPDALRDDGRERCGVGGAVCRFDVAPAMTTLRATV